MKDLAEIRDEIDAIDRELLALLKERIALARSVHAYKAENQLSALSPNRWSELTAKHKSWCSEMGVDYSLAAPIFDIIHEYVLTNIHVGLTSEIKE